MEPVAPSATVSVVGATVTVGAWFCEALSVMVTVVLAETVEVPSLTVTVTVTSVFAVTCGAVKEMTLVGRACGGDDARAPRVGQGVRRPGPMPWL